VSSTKCITSGRHTGAPASAANISDAVSADSKHEPGHLVIVVADFRQVGQPAVGCGSAAVISRLSCNAPSPHSDHCYIPIGSIGPSAMGIHLVPLSCTSKLHRVHADAELVYRWQARQPYCAGAPAQRGRSQGPTRMNDKVCFSYEFKLHQECSRQAAKHQCLPLAPASAGGWSSTCLPVLPRSPFSSALLRCWWAASPLLGSSTAVPLPPAAAGPPADSGIDSS
jgi:hypothetical protein